MKFSSQFVLTIFMIMVASTANALVIDTNLWTVEASPRNSLGSNWTSVGGNQAIQDLNASGALISDFSFTGDFSFAGDMTPTITVNDDDDILGVIFGWQDAQNHYRLGWEQGGWDDTSGASGMFLVRELNGVSSILFETENFWADDTTYNFATGRAGDTISFSLNGFTQSFVDSTFMDGKVGFYTESQSAIFAGLAGDPEPPNPVPEPGTIFLFGIGCIGLISSAKLKKMIK